MSVTAAPSRTRDRGALVYASACSGHGDIYLADANKGQPVRLTDSPRFESSPVFTPDGQRIYFCLEQDGLRHVWSMNSDGSDQQQITTGNVLDDLVAISPDGRNILIHRTEASRFGQGRFAKAFVANLATPAGEPKEFGTHALFTPDGRSIVFAYDESQLWITDLDSDQQVRPFPGRGVPLGFSADGRYLLTSRSPAQPVGSRQQEIWVEDLADKSSKHIGQGDSAVILGRRDYRVMIFEGYASNRRAFITGIDGGTLTRVPLPKGLITTTRISMDGDELLFANFFGSGDPNYDIYSIDADTLQVTQLASVRCNAP